MMRILFAAFLVIHGFIHLMGFVKAWNISDVSQLSGVTLFPLGGAALKFVGLLWLIVCLCFIGSAAAFYSEKDWWWMAAAIATVISQGLIILYWKDAWAGTIANVVVLPVVIVSAASWSFNNTVRHEVETLLSSSASANRSVVTREMLSGLPPCVQRWLEHSGAAGHEMIRTVRLTQTGRMRTSPEGSWMPVEADQYFSVDAPAFIWKANVEAFPLVHIAGRDKYEGGRGNMLIKLLSILPVVNSTGKEIDQGTMLRYLAETAWFPTAALSRYISWEAIDSASCRATMSVAGVTASGVFTFDGQGNVVKFEAQRYGEFNGAFSLETWSITMGGHRALDGIIIPSRSEVTWKLKAGDYTWFTLEITDIAYNLPELYVR